MILHSTLKNRLLVGAASLGALAAFAAPAFAQDQAAPATLPSDAPATGPAAAPTDDIVVTGSLFRRTNTETPSPVTVLTTETLSRAGITNINDAVRSISADGAGSISTGFTNGFSAGGAAVSLRGLGVSSTLVLIDGTRSTNFPLNDDGHNAYVDLNSIPFSAVERVEVLKDGASSSYGADAIGGVVNIIMKKHFTGLAGTVEGGVTEKGDGARYRGNLTAGYGDYDEKGWNFYVNGEYQKDQPISATSRGFPYNTNDLSSIGGLDNNTGDSALTTQSTNAVVRRAPQTDLNNPFAGGVATGTYTLLGGTAACNYGTFTVAGAAGGTGCKHDYGKEYGTRYNDIQPAQERYSFTGRLSFRVAPTVEGYLTGSYSHSEVTIGRQPSGIRQTQPYGASPTQSSSNPGIVLPVYICSTGVNCATASDRTLNPNNPYAAAGALDPANNAARIYYAFGDIPVYSKRDNEVFRGAFGLNGDIAGDYHWKIDAVGARDNFSIENHGVLDIAGLKKAVNTGAYNFVNPALNTQAVRDMIAPVYTTPSHTSLISVDASIAKDLFALPGGNLQVAVGGQFRHETEENNSNNPGLTKYANTSAAFGTHDVTAGYFEINAPILTTLEVNGSGRYDHYSEGFSHFSPKIGAKWTPIKQLAIRGTYSNGFRAPTFAENNPLSSYAGFVTVTPPASFQQAHGGLITGTNPNTNPYAQAYSLGSGATGNPNLKPEKSRSFTGGVVVEPVRNVSFTVDYYNIKKTDVIVTGPDAAIARANYFAGTALPAGYTVSAVDAPDPLFPNALPRVLIINVPFVNAGSIKSSGLDFGANVSVPITDTIKFTSRLDLTYVIQYDLDPGNGSKIQKYVGTLGPYELSSGAGTPRVRGNWQNTIEFGPVALTATTYYVSRIKEVAADEGDDLSCAGGNLYGTGDKFCYVKRFIYADVNAAFRVNDAFTLNLFVGNITGEKAPLAPASYSGANYLPTWHMAGIVGRSFRAGANFKF
ncbi:TonB-dependent receptor plug domain-containing protein [Sphingomonas sp. BAUL-RG-20F-R05-02]|uniref:TonB-dependent receptor plug domain-containing protein n=1 Tax=Sphingomonas sp. BAUL-RG-20F-R05-02 TaxID=2914830 RepID=UPI001F55DDC8|nr:TonB-dependent receptor [Sphingomonas sp. BAUL-RG-20F-R05-02]